MKTGARKLAARAGVAFASLSGISALMPALALAEEEKSGIAVLLPDMNEFIPMLVAFLIVLAVLAKFGWPAFENILDKREASIRESLEKSEVARIESERLLAEYQEKLAEARAEAKTIVAEAKQMGESVRADITAQAQAEAENIIAKAREAVAAEKKAAIGDLQASVADLTVEVTAHVIGRDFSDEDHRKLIERSIEEVGNLNA